MKRLLMLLGLLLCYVSLFASGPGIKSGPMLGYSEMRESIVWIQTEKDAKVEMEYFDIENPKIKFRSNIVKTDKTSAYTAKLVADKVEPGKKYEYKILLNDKQVKFDYPTILQTPKLWQWREDPPSLRIAMGSGTFINEEKYDRAGKPYGGGYEIFKSIYNIKPDIMLWLGDNVYLREADYYSRTGVINRYTHVRSLAEMQALLANTHNYAILDDHDFGPNDSDRGFVGKEMTMDVFKMFWANPSYGFQDMNAAVTMFSWADCDFFLLDNRSFRSPNNRKTGERVILGEKQKQWLFDNLAYSKAKFKFVVMGGQFLNSAAVYENYACYPEERNEIINYIENEKIEGVIFISGDRHFTELSKLKNSNKPMMLDFTSSPLCSGPVKDACTKEVNSNRIEGTCFNERNFGVIEVSGKLKNRQIKFITYDSNGKLIWEKSFLESDFKAE